MIAVLKWLFSQWVSNLSQPFNAINVRGEPDSQRGVQTTRWISRLRLQRGAEGALQLMYSYRFKSTQSPELTHSLDFATI